MFTKKISVLLLTAVLFVTAACGTPAVSSASSTTPVAPPASNSTSASPSGSMSASPESLLPNQQPECVVPPARISLKIAALKGPSALGMLPLMEYSDRPELNMSTANDYVYTIAGAPDQLVGGVISGEFDIAVLPTNLAATVYNKTGGKVKLATINTLGVLYVVETGDSIQSIADLKGKTIYSTAKGSTPEFALDYVLRGNGLVPGTDVTVEFRAEHSELTAMLAAGQADLALLPQPFVEVALAQNPKLRVALDLTKEWESVAKDGSSLAMSGIVVQQKLLDENPQAVAAFLEEYENSTKQVLDPANLEQIAELAVKREIIANQAIAKKAIPQCSIVYLAGNEMKTAASGFLKALFAGNPASVGGKLPDDGFYYLP